MVFIVLADRFVWPRNVLLGDIRRLSFVGLASFILAFLFIEIRQPRAEVLAKDHLSYNGQPEQGGT